MYFSRISTFIENDTLKEPEIELATELVFELVAVKAKLKGFLAFHIVAMVTYRLAKT